MKNTSAFFPILLILCAFCSKDQQNNQIFATLTSGSWYQKSYQTDQNEDGVFEESAYPCQIDDSWHFAQNNTFEIRDELAYCDPDMDTLVVLSGTWELRDNNTKIYVEFGQVGPAFEFHIHSINDTLLEIRSYMDFITQTPFEERITLTR
ncbi:MAG TPA: hypothetical protein DCF33_11760 [Saprospirales bacterium]|nr:hypothetical protein [Saprospirales bacterium]